MRNFEYMVEFFYRVFDFSFFYSFKNLKEIKEWNWVGINVEVYEEFVRERRIWIKYIICKENYLGL